MVIGLSNAMRDELLDKQPRLKHVFKVRVSGRWVVVGWATAGGMLKMKHQLEALFKTEVKVALFAEQ